MKGASALHQAVGSMKFTDRGRVAKDSQHRLLDEQRAEGMLGGQRRLNGAGTSRCVGGTIPDKL